MQMKALGLDPRKILWLVGRFFLDRILSMGLALTGFFGDFSRLK
jgi:hypothetical protein